MVAPIEFPVEGRPPSQSTKNSERRDSWKKDVRTAARKAVPSDAGLLDGPLRMWIDIYLRGKPPSNKPPDVDNMIKPIPDALKGSLYADDTTIEEIRARRIDRDEREPDRGGASDELRGMLDRWYESWL